MFKQKASQSKPKTSYSTRNDNEIEEIKQNLFSKTEKFAREKISQEDLEDFCYNLLDTIQNQARELVDLYYSQFEPIQSARNTNSNINFSQRPLLNIYIPSSQYFGQFTNQIANPYASCQVQPPYDMRPYSNSISPIANSYSNYQIQPMPNMQPYNNPYISASMAYPFGLNMLSNSISTKMKKSKKSKSKKSESEHKKHKEHKKKEKVKEKVVEKRHEPQKPKPKPKPTLKSVWDRSEPLQQSHFQISGGVRQFPYNPQQTGPGRFVEGIMNNLCRGISASSPNSPINIDSSSKFVSGYGYPRNVLPGGSYFQAANDDEDFWIRFDFKERSVKLTNYYIDSDNIKNWEIQISDDGIEWETIDFHSDYSTTRVKTVFNADSGRFVHFIRLHQTGEISPGSRSSLKINTIEFYGQLKDN